VHFSGSTIWEWVKAEGFEWKRQQSWFHEAEKHDPEFVSTRGRECTSSFRQKYATCFRPDAPPA
jgi:hypothetical protein